MTDKELLIKATEARAKAYVPYSGFSVGAALLCHDGKVFCGCNIENAAFTPTICAERTAFAKAVSEGYKDFVKIAVVGGKEKAAECFPCGVCRQVMAEFCDSDFEIITGNVNKIDIYKLKEILPNSFSKKDL